LKKWIEIFDLKKGKKTIINQRFKNINWCNTSI
jgi:hypothetical protein